MERRLSFAVSDTDEVSMNLSHSFGAADASTSRKRPRTSDDNFVSPQAYLRAKDGLVMALERQIGELQTELKTAVSEKQRIESSVNSQLQLLQEQLNLERTRSKNALEEAETLREKAKNARDQLRAIQAQIDEKERSLNAEITSLRRDRDAFREDMEDERRAWRVQKEQLQTEVAQLQSSLQISRNRGIDLQTPVNLEQTHLLQERIDALEAEIAMLRDQDSMVPVLDREVRRLKDMENQYQAAVVELEKARRDRSIHVRTVEELVSERDMRKVFEKQLDEMRRKLADQELYYSEASVWSQLFGSMTPQEAFNKMRSLEERVASSASLGKLVDSMVKDHEKPKDDASDANKWRLEALRLEKEQEILVSQVRQLEAKLNERDFNPATTKILHLAVNPETVAKSERAADEASKLRAENKLLQEQLRKLQSQLQSGSSAAPANHEKVAAELEETKKMNSRIKEMFRHKAKEFRDAVYLLFGWKVDLSSENLYRLQSMYAENESDILLFQFKDNTMHLLDSPFARSLDPQVLQVLQHNQSLPVFLSCLTQVLFEKRTVA